MQLTVAAGYRKGLLVGLCQQQAALLAQMGWTAEHVLITRLCRTLTLDALDFSNDLFQTFDRAYSS